MKLSRMLFAFAAALSLLAIVVAQEPAAPSADAVLEELLEAGRPTIEPTQRPRGEARQAAPRQLDPAVLGVAPGATGRGPAAAPRLKPEGQFIINRRARLMQSGDGMRSVLVFEADSPEHSEPPMILLPCQLLENMETLVQERGDNLVFIVSGQVTIYRGVNHLLPTMMRIASDPENLRP